MTRRKPSLVRALLLSCLAFAAAMLLIVLLGQAVTRFLMTDAAQDVDVAISVATEYLSTGRRRSNNASRPPGARYRTIGPAAWRSASDCNATFNRLRTASVWRPRVLRPPTAGKRSGSWGSWVVLLENFTTAAEARAIVDGVGHDGVGHWRSAGVKGAGTAPGLTVGARRGEATFCGLHGSRRCGATMAAVLRRVQSAVGISTAHFEEAQLLRYRAGGYYASHHDSSLAFNREHGVRALTALLYLSDLPEGGGGETAFPRLTQAHGGAPLAVAPRVGRLLVWPNVRDDEPTLGVADLRMLHEARTVTAGTKLAANVWVRLHRLW